jgi:uncharacterized SAM-binding protein YcdF (DUF218 family)
MSFIGCVAVALVVLVAMVGVAGYSVYNKAGADSIEAVDAIVVLGGAHDGREDYGIELARRGYARNVVLSDPYNVGDVAMRTACAAKGANFAVTCVSPVPATTRGEAVMTRRLADEHGWDRIMVITLRYHIPRARFIFSQCFGGEILMRPTEDCPRYSLARWEYNYLYQTFGFVKAFVEGHCGP